LITELSSNLIYVDKILSISLRRIISYFRQNEKGQKDFPGPKIVIYSLLGDLSGRVFGTYADSGFADEDGMMRRIMQKMTLNLP